MTGGKKEDGRRGGGKKERTEGGREVGLTKKEKSVSSINNKGLN